MNDDDFMGGIFLICILSIPLSFIIGMKLFPLNMFIALFIPLFALIVIYYRKESYRILGRMMRYD